MKIKQKWIKRILGFSIAIFLLMNIVAYFHAYKFTHFTNEKSEKTLSPEKLSTYQKVKTLLLGVDNPRPKNNEYPTTTYQSIRLNSNKEIECWKIPTENARGTVILFHGYSGQKSSMLDKEAIFRNMGYNTFLVDFMGSGGSEGNQTTIGFFEAEQVKTAFDYTRNECKGDVFLFGTSMGAVAIMKAINDYNINPSGIIIECPFGSLRKTISARFKSMGMPTFPMVDLLVFWGGIQNSFWGFSHNPIKYAEKIKCPTLLLFGAQDAKVSQDEIDEIFTNIKGHKQLKVYSNSGHEDYLTNHKVEWVQDVSNFINTYQLQ